MLDNIKQPGESSRSTLFKKFAFQSENIWTLLDEGKYVLIKNNLNEEDKSNFDENPYLKFHSGSDLA